MYESCALRSGSGINTLTFDPRISPAPYPNMLSAAGLKDSMMPRWSMMITASMATSSRAWTSRFAGVGRMVPIGSAGKPVIHATCREPAADLPDDDVDGGRAAHVDLQ